MVNVVVVGGGVVVVTKSKQREVRGQVVVGEGWWRLVVVGSGWWCLVVVGGGWWLVKRVVDDAAGFKQRETTVWNCWA